MNTLISLQEAAALIAEGRPLMFAADEALLRQLPKGRWVGGTIPYFMSAEGGKKTADQLFVTQLPDFVREAEVRLYPPDQLPSIPSHYPENGASFAILPASSQAHVTFAHHSSSWKGLFDRPLVGWIAGVDLADLGKVSPKVFIGTGESSDNAAAVMHVKLPADRHAEVDIINLFSQGAGDALTFATEGFEIDTVFVNGKARNFADYLSEKGVDTRLPLVADYNGAMVNISFQAVNQAKKSVSLYAPVFEGVTYRIASPLTQDYANAFQRELAARAVSPVFACNCILNYLYGELEGKKTGQMQGPITFGEIAYMLLNQTLVYIDFVKH